MPDPRTFPPEVARRLRTYVYRLIDLETAKPFTSGRVVETASSLTSRDEQNLEGDPLDNKLSRIREIRRAGLAVAHVIHRHGMDDETAFAVEAALIDAYRGLANITGGLGAS